MFRLPYSSEDINVSLDDHAAWRELRAFLPTVKHLMKQMASQTSLLTRPISSFFLILAARDAAAGA